MRLADEPIGSVQHLRCDGQPHRAHRLQVDGKLNLGLAGATDFSATGNQAVRCAFEEAERHHATVTLVHVLHHQPDTGVYFLGGDPETRAGLRSALIAYPYGYEPYTGLRLPSPSASLPVTVTQDFDEEALEHLRELVPETFTGRWEVAVASGDPARAIVHVAEEHEADLIVIGAHGHTGFLHTLLGGVAEKVVRHAPCAVLTVKAPIP